MEYSEKNQIKWLGLRPCMVGDLLIIDGNKSNGYKTLYTVPSDKKLLIMNGVYNFRSTGNSSGFVEIADAGPVRRGFLYSFANSIANTGSAVVPYFFPIELPEDWIIRLNVSNTLGVMYTTLYCNLVDV